MNWKITLLRNCFSQESKKFSGYLVAEVFKYRENMNNNKFREIHKSFLKTAKFEYFAKQIIYSYSRDHLL